MESFPLISPNQIDKSRPGSQTQTPSSHSGVKIIVRMGLTTRVARAFAIAKTVAGDTLLVGIPPAPYWKIPVARLPGQRKSLSMLTEHLQYHEGIMAAGQSRLNKKEHEQHGAEVWRLKLSLFGSFRLVPSPSVEELT